MLKKSLNILFLVLGISLLNVSAQTDQKIKTISKGVVNGSAVSLPKPDYPAAAKAVRAGGAVNVQVTIDEQRKCHLGKCRFRSSAASTSVGNSRAKR